ISLGISGMSNLKKVGRVGGKALIYFEVVTTFALLIGIVVSHVVEPGAGVAPPPSTAGNDMSQFTQQATDFSWMHFFKENVTIQVLLFSILFGILLSKYSRKEKVTHVLSTLSGYVFKALHLVMYLAPIGAFGGMAYTIGKYGID